jgi:hypothetical protein
VLPGDLTQKWSRIRDSDAAFRKSLGHWLRNRVGRYAAGWSLIDAGRDSHTKNSQYVVKPPTP